MIPSIRVPRRTQSLRLALLTTAALAACGPAIPPVPSQGGPAWHELTSEHFTLWTNASLDRGRELIRDMEDLRHVVIGIGFRGGGEGRVFVIALRDDAEVRAFLPGDIFDAMASPANSYIHQPLIAFSAQARGVLVAHELTHTISQTVIREQSRWFAEGLAKYFETIEIDRERGRVDLGRAPSYEGRPVVITRPMPLRQLVACKDLRCVDEHFYTAAWALFTYLMNVKGARLDTFEQIVATANLDELEAEMKQWLVSGSHTVLHYDVKLRDWPVAVRELGDADVHAARALLRLQFQGRRDLARTEADAAVALDPTHVLARVILYVLDRKVDAEAARQAAQAHPDDWRAWWLVVAALGGGDEAREAHVRACELIAKNPAIVSPWRQCLTR